MEANLEELIGKIREEGMEKAEAEARKKIEEAEKKANEIITGAEQKAEQIVEDARQEAEQLKESGEDALKQAQRDTILVTKERITDLLDRIFKRKINETLTPEFLSEIIRKVVEQLGADQDYEIFLDDEDREKLAGMIVNEAREEISEEQLDLIPDREVEAGIKVSVKGEDVYYDLSDEGIADYLTEFLNPAIQEILEENE